MEYIVGSVKSRDKEKQRGIGFVNCFQYHLFYIDGIFFVKSVYLSLLCYSLGTQSLTCISPLTNVQ